MTRSNGLGAPAYVALAEFEPGLDDRDAQAVLYRLEQAGIAAYLAPTGGGDQLYVDSRQTRRAWVLLSPTTLSPALTGTDRSGGEPAHDEQPDVAIDEQVWAELVESFNAADDGPIGRWPSVEDVDEDGAQTGEASDGYFDDAAGRADTRDPTAEPARRRGPNDPGGGGWERYLGSPDDRADLPADEPEEHYEPPDPPPLPHLSATVVTGWLGALGIPVLLVVAGLIGLVVPTWLLLLAAGGFMYGLVVLFSLLRSSPFDPDDPDGNDDGDSGARV